MAMYRETTLGLTFKETLAAFIDEGTMTPEQAKSALETFDRTFYQTLSRYPRNEVQINGHLNTYRNIDNVWTFVLEQPSITLAGSTAPLPLESVKIVAVEKGSVDKNYNVDSDGSAQK